MEAASVMVAHVLKIDREVASTLADLIIGSEIDGQGGQPRPADKA